MRKELPIFSIVTVCLNAGKELEKTVGSVLDQDFADYEVIVKDGGSIDGSVEALPKEGRIRIFRQPDAGIFDAMNQALALAKGEFVCFLNAGDYFLDSTVLKDVADVVANNRDASFFYGNVYKAQGRAGFNFYPDHLSRFFLFTRMLCHQCWFVRRSTYLAYGGFETEYSSGGDCRLLLKMLVRDGLKYTHVPRPVVYYKGGGHSANPMVKEQTDPWVAELRAQVFSSFEYAAFSMAWNLWLVAKKGLYDRFIWRIWRDFQYRRVNFIWKIKS